MQPDVIILECTRSYCHQDVVAVMGDRYTLDWLVFSPAEVGVPAERFRKYMVLLKKHGGRLQWKEPGLAINEENFLKVFGRTLSCNGHVFMNGTPSSLVQQEAEARATTRHLPGLHEGWVPLGIL